MKKTSHNRSLPTSLLLVTGILSLLSPNQVEAESNTSFEKDRAAILALAGKFKITFNFHETHSLKKNYTPREKAYTAEAHEIVKVIEDTGKRIVLQHLLQVDGDEGTMVVKHWGQVWTFEDTEILEYQGGTSWKKRSLEAASVRGTWSQYVTQTDDSPRYESYGAWNHHGGTSIWISTETPRPLPRREYTKRKDYDVVMGINTHTITPNGWIHDQQNRKLVKRDGQPEHYLCAEHGYNTYQRVPKHDFSASESYWKTHSPFWKSVRAHWTAHINKSDNIRYTRKINGKSMSKAVRMLMADEDEKQPAQPEAIPATLAPYLNTKS